MKTYPSIPHFKDSFLGLSIYAFDKIDGSNIRAEFSLKSGFHKFGTKTRLLGTDQGILYKSKELIETSYDDIKQICIQNRWNDITLFYEFSGVNSFAGNHQDDDVHTVKLIDANPYKVGILPPREFLEYFSNCDIAPLLYHGNCSQDFVTLVETGTLDGIGPEGVVCKAKGKGNTILTFKIKQLSWYLKLKQFCGNDDQKFNLLK